MAHFSLLITLPIWCCKFFFKNMGQPRPLFRLFSSFQTNISILTTNKCEKCPSSIRRRDSNAQPSDYESPHFTRPGLPPFGVASLMLEGQFNQTSLVSNAGYEPQHRICFAQSDSLDCPKSAIFGNLPVIKCDRVGWKTFLTKIRTFLVHQFFALGQSFLGRFRVSQKHFIDNNSRFQRDSSTDCHGEGKHTDHL